jgi:hypothetical protein
METTLEHRGNTIENPTDADIDRALAGPRDEHWFMTLGRGEASMDAMIDAGNLWVEVTEGDRFVQALSKIDEGVVRSMLVSFRDGNDAWRDMALWKEPTPAKRDSENPAKMLIGGMIAFLLVFGAGAVALGGPGWGVVAFALAFPGIIAVATVAKLAEVRRAASWTETTGRITRSGIATEIRGANDTQRKVTVPRIEYEYKVGLNTMVGRRVNLGELIAGVQAKEARARFPVGASVPVFYNPADPRQAVLERELPPFVHAVWGLVAAMLAVIGLAAWFFLIRK